jgi:hypothetical protein
MSSYFNIYVKLCFIDPKRQPVKMKYFWISVIHVHLPISFVLIVIETCTRCLSPPTVLCIFLKTSVCAKICRRRFNSCFALIGQICDEISWRGGNFVTHTNKNFLGPRLLLSQKSFKYNLGPEFRQPLNKKNC